MTSSRAGLIVGSIALLALAAGCAGLGYLYWHSSQDLAARTQEADALTASLASTTHALIATQDELTAEQQKNRTFSAQISQISGTVGQLDTLAHTDPQLLAKYSKIYFLNENYVPASLAAIDSKYLYDSSRKIQLLAPIQSHFYQMLDAAQAQGVDLLVASGYRSFGEQAALKTSYKITYGAGTANSFSADQGYSEHQLGTAFDFTTKQIGGGLAGFDKTPAYAWLLNNAYQYGFVLSYPKGNAYYTYEPWHWRFVGAALATKLHAENQQFYDLDQREINTYLISFFN